MWARPAWDLTPSMPPLPPMLSPAGRSRSLTISIPSTLTTTRSIRGWTWWPAARRSPPMPPSRRRRRSLPGWRCYPWGRPRCSPRAALLADLAPDGFGNARAESLYLRQIGAFHHHARQRLGAGKAHQHAARATEGLFHAADLVGYGRPL